MGRVRQGSVLVIVQRGNSVKNLLLMFTTAANVCAFFFFLGLTWAATYSNGGIAITFAALSLYPVIVEIQFFTIKKLEKSLNEQVR